VLYCIEFNSFTFDHFFRCQSQTIAAATSSNNEKGKGIEMDSLNIDCVMVRVPPVLLLFIILFIIMLFFYFSLSSLFIIFVHHYSASLVAIALHYCCSPLWSISSLSLSQISDNYWPALLSEPFSHHPTALDAISAYKEAYHILKKPR
jgi:hypothetical protein